VVLLLAPLEVFVPPPDDVVAVDDEPLEVEVPPPALVVAVELEPLEVVVPPPPANEMVEERNGSVRKRKIA